MKPAASTLPQLDLPETLRYRVKNRLLGPPIATERQSTERLGKPTALAVLSSDVISSSAYATEQMLIPLIPLIGVAAFSLVIPISIAVIFVLLFVTLSYLEVVKVYTKAGGAYVVARENFGLNVAQVAAMSLLIDYTLTVAVSVAAGVAAITSVIPSLTPYTTWIAIGLVILLAYGNLRGVREPAARSPSPPTSSLPTWCSSSPGGFTRRQPGPCTPMRSPGTRVQSPSGRRGAAFSTEPPCLWC